MWKHHAEEEEEGKMFPKLRKAFDSKKIEELGQDLEQLNKKSGCKKLADGRRID